MTAKRLNLLENAPFGLCYCASSFVIMFLISDI